MVLMLGTLIFLFIIIAVVQYFNPKVLIFTDECSYAAEEAQKIYLAQFPVVHIEGAFPWNLLSPAPVSKPLKETLEQVEADSTRHRAYFLHRYGNRFDLEYTIQRENERVTITYIGCGILQNGNSEAIKIMDSYPDFIFMDHAAGENDQWDIPLWDDGDHQNTEKIDRKPVA